VPWANVTAFLDTAIFMYASGGEHPLRGPCKAILRGVADGRLDATTSAEVVQEILHRFVAIRRLEDGVAMAREVLRGFGPVLSVSHAVMSREPDLVERYPTLTARDLVHVATSHEEGIDRIVSPDTGFDMVADLRRVDPTDRSLAG
jgi:uncharacterized protein